MQNRPLRDFERGAHLHVLDWAHETARMRFQAAGAAQVKAAARAVADAGLESGPPELPALEAAICAELRKLYALGHATVRSELDHQRTGNPLPVGLSAAPAPPNLRKAAHGKKGRFPHCGNCRMYDASPGVCWGYGNYPVKPNEVCDSYAPDSAPKQLALDDDARDPGRLRARARLVAAHVAHQVWQAVQRGRLQGIAGKRLRQLGREAGASALGQSASHHAGGAISAGRHAAALQVIPGGGEGGPPSGVIGARYTAILDKSTCGPCAAADDGVLRSLTNPGLVRPPNPACLGGDRCRCLLVYQLGAESGGAVLPVAAGG